MRQEMQPTLDMQQRPPDWYTYVIQRAVSDAVEKATKPLQEQMKEIQGEMRAANTATEAKLASLDTRYYPREIIDSRLRELQDRQTAIGNLVRNAVIYGGGAITLIVLVYQHISLH